MIESHREKYCAELKISVSIIYAHAQLMVFLFSFDVCP